MGQALRCHPSRLAAPETRGLGAGVGVAYAHGDGFQMREGKGRGVTRNPAGARYRGASLLAVKPTFCLGGWRDVEMG